MSKYNRTFEYDDDGRLIPDETYMASRRTIRTAAHAVRMRGDHARAQQIEGELDVKPLSMLAIAYRQLPDPDVRIYALPASLRGGMSAHIHVVKGTDVSQFTELTRIGRALAPAIAVLFPVTMVTVTETELYIEKGGAFDWDDDENLHDCIVAIIAHHLMLTDFVLKSVVENLVAEDPAEEAAPAGDDPADPSPA